MNGATGIVLTVQLRCGSRDRMQLCNPRDKRYEARVSRGSRGA